MSPFLALFHRFRRPVALVAACAALIVPVSPLHPDRWHEPSDLVDANAALGDSVSPAVLDQAEAPDTALARALRLRLEADPDGARAIYDRLAQQPDPNVASAAQLGLAALKTEAGASGEAAATLEALLARYGQTSTAERAQLALGIARREAGDCAGALTALGDQRLRAGRLKGYAGYEAALCYQAAGDTGATLAQVAASLDGAPRLLRVELLEMKANALNKQGQTSDAVAVWNELQSLAGTASYRAQTRMTAAGLLRDLGRSGEAAKLYVQVVIDAPSMPAAGSALDALRDMDELGLVSYYQAGLVRYNAGDWPSAQRNFEGSLLTPSEAPNHPAARYFLAIARLRQGAENEAADALLALPGSYPASDFAPQALMRAGKLLEGLDRTNDALAAYARLAKDYPASSLAAQAQLRIGLLSVFHGRPADGAPSLSALARSDASPGMRAWALMWLGKIEASGGNAEAARGRWQAAVQTSPLTFGGFRSAGLLNGDQKAVAGSSGLDPGKVGVSAQELADLDAWLAAKGVNRQALSDQLTADPALARADDLLAMGQAELAGWELDDLARRGPEAERQYVLSLAMADRGLARLAMTQVLDGLRKGGVASADAPTALQKLLYPLPYAGQLAARGAQYGADPLLLAALIRQESAFNPRARSRANALGLAQVLPSTGAGIARALGRPAFQESDLFRPEVGIEFGAYYLGQALSRRGGQVFPSLAGYNAGNGAVDGWLRDPANADADVFSERIPYPETENYVHIVFENYGMYRALYSK